MLDLIIKNVRVVRPNKNAVDLLDLGIKNGKFHTIAPEIAVSDAKEVFDGQNYLAFPGLVDAHMRAYTEIVEREGTLSGLHAYSASRPPHSEGLAIFIASYLANETDCVNINLLHLTSRKAVDAAMLMQAAFPHINFKREVTIGHLLLDVDSPAAWRAKVNPPIRPRADV